MHNPILSLWHSNIWRSDLNHLEVPCQPYFEFIERKALEQGTLLKEEGARWIAPLYAIRQNNTYWIPVWIPIEIKDNKITLSTKSLPWMPPAHTESLGSSPFAGGMHFVDEFLRFEWLDENNQLASESWHEGRALIENLLDELSNNTWQNWLAIQGLSLSDNVIVIDEKQLVKESKSANALSTNYAFMDEFEAKQQLTLMQGLVKAALLCSQKDPRPLSAGAFMSSIHTMILEQGEILGVKAPVGSDNEKFIDSIVTSKLIHSYLEKQSQPLILKYKMGQVFLYDFTIDEKKAQDVRAVMAIVEQGLDLAVKIVDILDNIADQYTDDETQETIAQLQAEDEIYEKQLTRLIQLQTEYVNKKRRHALVSWLLPSKKTSQKDLAKIAHEIDEPDIVSQETLVSVLSDRIRQTKVSRTKIHQQLVDLVEQNATLMGAKNRWEQWLKANVSVNENATLEEQILAMQGEFSHKIYNIGLVQGQWRAIEKIQDCEMLIVEDSQKLLPAQLAQYLPFAQRVICLGDSQDITALPLMSPATEEWELARFNLHDEITIEQLQYKGMLFSTGNAFSVALVNSTYQEIYDHSVQLSSFSIASNDEYELQYHALAVNGASNISDNRYINEMQAQFIAQWLTTGPLVNELQRTAIITPFMSQKVLLKQKLKAQYINCEVFTFDELPAKQWQNIIFSPVYSAHDQRPFVFDQGDNMLYSLQRRSTKNIWVIGDLGIFDARMHSPSGNLAKKLFANKVQMVE